MAIRRLQKLLTNRRNARRHKVEHEVSLIAGVVLGEGEMAELITGRTRDISETGLSLSLPIEDELQREQTEVGKAARILLVLPTKTVHLRGEIVRSLLLHSKGQLVGVKITRLEAEDKAAYTEYLSSLK